MKKQYKYHLLLSLEYDGSNFNGWIIQKQNRTIQGELEKAIKTLTKNNDFWLIGASKTDAKVHAVDQKVLLNINFIPKDLDYFKDVINKTLVNDIYVKNVILVNSDFNVRDVKEKEYEYIINDQNYNVFTQRYEMFWKYEEIDINKLQDIFNLFIGKHDFFLFSGLSYNEKEQYQTIRTISNITVKRNDEHKVSIHFISKGFIRYQIRMIIEAAIQCYLNNPRSTYELIKQRLLGIGTKSPYTASPNGLKLIKIKY